MKAVVWNGRRDVRVETVPDPEVREPTDAVIRVTSSAICGSDLHLYEERRRWRPTRADRSASAKS